MRFLPETYGVRWGIINKDNIQVVFEQLNLINLENIKEKLKNELNHKLNHKLHYYIYKKCIRTTNGYDYSNYECVEFEKEFILKLS